MTEPVTPSQQPEAATAGGTGADEGAAPPPLVTHRPASLTLRRELTRH